jgi:hypothetical protein
MTSGARMPDGNGKAIGRRRVSPHSAVVVSPGLVGSSFRKDFSKPNGLTRVPPRDYGFQIHFVLTC